MLICHACSSHTTLIISVSSMNLFFLLILFKALTTNIVYKKPKDPLSYMMKEIQQMKKSQEKQKS